jgi:hypothetical protein
LNPRPEKVENIGAEPFPMHSVPRAQIGNRNVSTGGSQEQEAERNVEERRDFSSACLKVGRGSPFLHAAPWPYPSSTFPQPARV